MKKLIVLAAFTVCMLNVSLAQTAGPKFVYCELIEVPRPFSTKVNITVDYGQSRSFFADNRLRDEATGRIKKFNSMIDALNYMTSEGWEFVQVYTTIDASTGTNTGTSFGSRRYMLRRALSEAERQQWLRNQQNEN